MDKPMTFDEWYQDWTGSKVKCENMDVRGAWQHQQAKVEELQEQFDQHDKLLLQRNKDVQELYDINEKHVAEKAELQKRVDSLEKAEFVLARIKSIASKRLLESILIKEVRQALKGES
ncbi:hypothetical protein [Acinetobacter seifertii]|uniref:hypothetical protein n=1 Tax=Acinetobacter seifertii TaxID=1530123 RepID=UPI00124E8687|nr:hypothetical protein [Acinetobacter seifertii]